MSMVFCRECNNMLYPKEDRVNRKLLYACRNCGHQEGAENPCIYRNEVLRTTEDKTVVVHDVATDPTLPRAAARCQKCGHKEAVYFQSSTRKDQAMTLYFVCCAPNCGHRWKE
eukprot:TRINITY_DN3245_c0_g1_i1.p1 TRINITY_DN3245_c0_g1~~TRINITY_DN3245_c0_g1_i1.p1  ORF type:complete len:113 (-),score=7.73 TRINITY_DN3245_c0_g1_i1:106-444(-)